MSRALVWLFSLLLSVSLVLMAVLGWLLLTTDGARWLVDWALERESRLSLSVVDGALATGLTVDGLAWRDQGLVFSAERLQFTWTMECLLAARLCVDTLRLSSPRLRVEEGEEEPAADGGAPARLELPLALRLGLLQVSDLAFETPGASGSLRSLQASGGFSRGELRLSWARLAGLRLELPEAEPAAEPGPARTAPILLPTPVLPVDLAVKGFMLEEAELLTGDDRYALSSLALDFRWRGSQLTLGNLELASEQLRAELSGRLRLQGDYPLSLLLVAELNSPELLAPLHLDAELGGSVAALELAARSRGAAEMSLRGDLRLLEPALPFQVDVDWRALSWPLVGDPVLTVSDGALRAGGELENYHIELSAAVSGSDLPSGEWALQASGDTAGLRIQRLAGSTLGGSVEGSALLGWANGLSWHGQLRAQGLEPERLWPEYPGRLAGVLSSEGSLVDGRLSLRAETAGVHGELRGYPFRLSGAVVHEDGDWLMRELQLDSGRNEISLQGRVGERLAVDGRLALPELSALLPGLSGAAHGRFSLGGELTEPDLELELDAGPLRYDEHALESLRLTAQIARLGRDDSRLEWRAGGVTVADQRLRAVTGSLAGRRAGHRLELSLDGRRMDAALTVTGVLADSFDWRGELNQAAVRERRIGRWRLAAPVELAWRQQAARFELGAHCWQREQASLCLSSPASLGANGELELALDEFRLDWLQPWLPREVGWDGPLSARASAAWSAEEAFRLNLRAESVDGRLRLEQELSDELTLSYRRLAAQVSLDEAGLSAELELDSEALGGGRLQLRTDPGAEPMPLAGEVDLAGLRLDVLRPFLPQLQTLAGTLGVQGRLGGSLSAPRFFGRVELAGAELAAPNLPVELREAGLTAVISGSEAELSGQFQTGGDGQGRIGGRADWSGQEWELDLEIDGEELLVVYEPLARLRVNPTLTLSLRPQRIHVGGRVVVPSGEITLEELPEGAVDVSDDVVVVRRPGGAAAEPAEPMPGWSVSMNVELVLGDRVKIAGQGLEGRLEGQLALRQRAGGVPEAVGELRLEEGVYEAYGQELSIRRGLLIFSGPIAEPSLSVEAVREVGDVVAGVRVEGRPEAPQASLFSEPAMPQEEILSYIIRGRPLGGDSSGAEQALLAQAALSLGIFSGQGVVSSLAEQLGIEDFELGTSGQGDETQFELSGYLNPDLFVRYGIGVFAPVNTLTVRYRLSDRFFVEAVSSLESAIDFLYEFRF